MEQSSRRIRRDFASLAGAARRFELFCKLTSEALMAGAQELQDKIAELRQAVSDDEASDAETVAKLNITIEDLRAQVAAGQPVDTQPLIDQLEEIKNSLVPADGGTVQPTDPNYQLPL